MTERLFVYGTLAPGRPNAHQLDGVAGTWQEASIRGVLHPEGWGATLGFPAVVLDPVGDVVPGFLFTSDELSPHWARLDTFEGTAYERAATTATLADGSTIEAWVYRLREPGGGTAGKLSFGD